MTEFDQLKKLLRELFQLDQPDLDFGLYRIMHAKADQVTQFLDRDLLPQVKEALSQYQPADTVALKEQLDKVIAGLRAAEVDPETSPKVQELRKKLNAGVDLLQLERDIYDHLHTFFSRYYDNGDFLSKRRYSANGKYAIPYDGEEVKLHWANHDQYYIKTSEYLRDYAFRLKPDSDTNPLRVHFQLVDAAEGEHGNVKPTAGKERVFILAAADPVTLVGEELHVRFEYRPATLADRPSTEAPAKKTRKKAEPKPEEADADSKAKPPTQKELLTLAEARILAVAETLAPAFHAELSKPHRKSDGTTADYHTLHAHLDRYTKRHTFDYFIHKDLGGFLRRELDFFIKNEVLHLDDIENETAPRVEQYLSKIKVLRRIAGKIITFLAQLEDFQKTLWLKKKFVVETQYCIALKEIPPAFYAEIAANAGQQAEWKALNCQITGGGQSGGVLWPETATTVTLAQGATQSRSAMLDTRHFSADFTARLLASLGDIDAKTDGVLIHSENFQSLNLMQTKYRESVDCVYIDPPYNTSENSFIYKNLYKHSSWASMIQGRIAYTKSLLCEHGIIGCAIDDTETARLRIILDDIFDSENRIASIAIEVNPAGQNLRPNTPYAFGEQPCCVAW